MGADQHRLKASPRQEIRVAVVTVSDTRTAATDEGGRLARELLAGAGYRPDAGTILRDEPADVATHVRKLVEAGTAEAIVLTGGTGISRRDTTVEALADLFDKTLDGFGELFRMLSFAEVGPAAMLSRATAGVVGGVLVFLLPGSPKAVRLGLDRLILPELAHMVGQLGAGSAPGETHHHGHGTRSDHPHG